MASDPLGITFHNYPGQQSVGVVNDADGIPAVEQDSPYLVAGSLQSPLPVFMADGDTYETEAGSVQTALRLNIDTSAPPENIDPPVISGDLMEGGELSSSTGTWSGDPEPELTYQWYLDGSPVPGATSSAWTTPPGSVGDDVTVLVTATNDLGSDSAESAPVVIEARPPQNDTAPVIDWEDDDLVVTPGEWSGSEPITLSYQWQRDGSDISGATGTSYTPVLADGGEDISVVETANNSGGSNSQSSSAVAVPLWAPENTEPPSITRDDDDIVLTEGQWTGSEPIALSHQWMRDGDEILGETGTTYTPVEGDEDTTISVVETATNSAGSVSEPSNGIEVDWLDDDEGEDPEE